MPPHPARLSPPSARTAIAVILALAALAAIACALPQLLRGTPERVIQCTPPPCAADETYACGSSTGDCPGGCGTICIKKTADPAAQPVTQTITPTVTATATQPAANIDNPYCPLVVRQPPAEAPTASVNGTAQPDKRVDPHVAFCASRASLPVGDELVLVGQAIDIGLPAYQLSVRDDAQPEFSEFFRWLGDQAESQAGASSLLEFITWRTEPYGLVLTLRASAAGSVELRLSATGEIHYGYPGPAMWGGGTSEVILVTIRP